MTVTQEASANIPGTLQRVPCIRYPVQFQENQEVVRALVDSSSEVNAMTLAYAAKLGVATRKTDVDAQKIDGSALVTYEMVIAGFLLQDKLEKVRFFEETFWLADTSMEVVLGMPFLILSDVDIRFAEKELAWRSYTTAEALPTTRRVNLIDKKKFAKAALDENSETFVVQVATLEAPESARMMVHLSRAAQIAALKWDKAPTEILSEYTDYAYVFSTDLAMELPENTGINENAIELIKGKKLSYGPIYSLGSMELETLKTYIKTYLKTGFIRPSKSPTGASIFFDKKPDGSFCLCVDYPGLNNLTIKN